MSQEVLVALDDVRVSLGGAEVLGGISLTLRRGERLAVLGTNAVGKSTLLDVVLGLTACRGAVCVDDEVRPGFVPQDPGASLLPWFDVRQNVLLPLEARGADPSTWGAALEEVRAKLDPDGALDLDAYPQALSGGQRQLAALMRGLIGRPRLLVCDEPFSAIDAPSRARLRRALEEVCEAEGGPSLLLVTHDVETALTLSTRLLVLAGKPARVAHELDPRRPDVHEALARALVSA